MSRRHIRIFRGMNVLGVMAGSVLTDAATGRDEHQLYTQIRRGQNKAEVKIPGPFPRSGSIWLVT